MDTMIAYCGLDCRECDAYLATINHDDELRKRTAEEWSKLNGINIPPESIHCEGCRADGVKTEFCHWLCMIRQCASNEEFETCGDCKELMSCKKVSVVINNNEKALKNLTQKE